MIANGPLRGVRLIEMDAIGPVPLAGMILSGLGAEVLRIKRPSGQHFLDGLVGTVLHRGRSTLKLDLKNPADRDTVLALVERADGLMEGARPGVMERLGLGPDECLGRNPRLVYGRMTGWGQDGPQAQAAGHDINYIAMTGALDAIGQKGQGPTVPLNLVGDFGGGSMFLALGMVSAIFSARATGKGQVVDAAMVDGVATLLGMVHALLAGGAWTERRGTNLLDGSAPFYRCYVCADGGHVAVGALEPQFFASLLEGLGVVAGRFEQNDEACWPEMERIFAETFAARPRGHWERVFASIDACVAPVLSLSEALVHPANSERGVFVEHDGVLQCAPAPRFSATPGGIAESRSVTAAQMLAQWTDNGPADAP